MTLGLSHVRHPDFLFNMNDWTLWRDTFEGGSYYLDTYLRKFSDQETDADFLIRKESTPIPTFAKSAVLDIRNSIFQRLEDVLRTGGSRAYQTAIAGEEGGVDRKGASMNSFIGIDVLTELLIMGRVGIYVDAPKDVPLTLADKASSPYCYFYPVEQILSWTYQEPGLPGQFKAVLLEDCNIDFQDNITGIQLPTGKFKRTRLLWWNALDGYVYYRIYDEKDNPVYSPYGDETAAVRLDINEIPFYMADIGDSLLKDTASYQKALLNLGSRDVNYALKGNSPFLVIQEELRTAGAHLKTPAGSPVPGAQIARDRIERVGGVGRYYDRDTDAPQFIAPPSDPTRLSMELQERLEDNIRRLINLAVENKVGSRTESAESKKLSAQGLEAGLSYIGLVLQEAERQIAKFWAAYEGGDPATVSYPSRYILKSDEERLKDAKDLKDLLHQIPGNTIKKVVDKLVAASFLTGKESVDTLEKIMSEIDAAPYITSSSEIIMMLHDKGMLPDKETMEALGIDPKLLDQARKDRATNAALIIQAQASASGEVKNPAARGVPELAKPGDQNGSQEQAPGKAKAKE